MSQVYTMPVMYVMYSHLVTYGSTDTNLALDISSLSIPLA
jgi:hypothetical protein